MWKKDIKLETNVVVGCWKIKTILVDLELKHVEVYIDGFVDEKARDAGKRVIDEVYTYPLDQESDLVKSMLLEFSEKAKATQEVLRVEAALE